MNLTDLQIIPLHKQYDRTAFDCGNDSLNRYFKIQVSQDVKRRVNSCFLVLDINDRIAGFYTLCSSSIPYSELSPILQKKLPRYTHLPATLIGRLAIDVHYQGKGLGAILLANAIRQATNSPIASSVIIVEAKDENAIAFYEHFGFLRFQSVADKLYYPLHSVSSLSSF